jgi:hypothetical protein
MYYSMENPLDKPMKSYGTSYEILWFIGPMEYPMDSYGISYNI